MNSCCLSLKNLKRNSYVEILQGQTIISSWHQFHHHFMHKCFTQLFSNYRLALKFLGKRITVQKLLIKFWWNWLLLSISSTLSTRNFCAKFWPKKIQTQNTAFVQNFGAKMRFCTINGCVKCWWNRLLVASSNPSSCFSVVLKVIQILPFAYIFYHLFFHWLFRFIYTKVVTYVCFSPFSPKRPGNFWSKDIDKWQLQLRSSVYKC